MFGLEKGFTIKTLCACGQIYNKKICLKKIKEKVKFVLIKRF